MTTESGTTIPMPDSPEELVLDVAEVMEDLVAHGVAGVDRTAEPPLYWLLPPDEMTPEAMAYFNRFQR